ncbi:hypothetical protein BGW42_002678 [Actinomortierella wolfii]|nr:hypothetical protein BGW42_002678 [Actinomortierella wolfii]
MEAKLTDFGLARIRLAMSSNLSISPTGGIITGTLGWTAPELFETDKPPYSTKTDVYALGVVMWEMAANCTRPYKDQDDRALLIQHVKSGGREKLPDDTPTEYCEWVERCWHHDPSQRPDANEVTLVRNPPEETDDDDDDDAAPISLTSSNGGVTPVDTKDKAIATSHPNNDTTSGHLPQTDDDVAIKKNVGDSAWWYRQAAERGNATAQLMLGEMHEKGQGVDASDVEAATWYRSAAVHGVVKAQAKLGGMYEEGRGVQQDDVEAFIWYRMAAGQGQNDAQIKVGAWYSLGRGVDQSDVEAAKWYTKAAEQGDTDAQTILGWMYQEGRGVEQSDVEAVKWYTKSAKQGVADAQNNLGIMYRDGRGVGQSKDEAIKWFRKAANQGFHRAQYNIWLI